MRREIHFIDGSVITMEASQLERTSSPTENTPDGKDARIDPILSRLRSLRTKAKRLGVWNSVLEDTERGIVNASLLLSKLGRRIRIILEELTFKLKQKLREVTLEGFRELGLSAAAPLMNFFRNSAIQVAPADDSGYLFYMGFRERFSHLLRAQPI